MTTFVVYVVVLAFVAGGFFLVASLVFGRGEELAPLPPGTTPTVLPESVITATDVRALRFRQVVRGYRAAEVDWALERLAGEIERLRAELDHQPTAGTTDAPDAAHAPDAPDAFAPDTPDAPDAVGTAGATEAAGTAGTAGTADAAGALGALHSAGAAPAPGPTHERLT